MSWWRTSRQSPPSWVCPKRSWPTVAMPTAMRLRPLPRAASKPWWRRPPRAEVVCHDFRSAKAEAPANEPKAEWLDVIAAKLASPYGRALYRLAPTDRRAGLRHHQGDPRLHRLLTSRPRQGDTGFLDLRWRWPTIASACTSSTWRWYHEGAPGPTGCYECPAIPPPHWKSAASLYHQGRKPAFPSPPSFTHEITLENLSSKNCRTSSPTNC